MVSEDGHFGAFLELEIQLECDEFPPLTSNFFAFSLKIYEAFVFPLIIILCAMYQSLIPRMLLALSICTMRNLIGFGTSGYSASPFFERFLIFGLAQIG